MLKLKSFWARQVPSLHPRSTPLQVMTVICIPFTAAVHRARQQIDLFAWRLSGGSRLSVRHDTPAFQHHQVFAGLPGSRKFLVFGGIRMNQRETILNAITSMTTSSNTANHQQPLVGRWLLLGSLFLLLFLLLPLLLLLVVVVAAASELWLRL